MVACASAKFYFLEGLIFCFLIAAIAKVEALLQAVVCVWALSEIANVLSLRAVFSYLRLMKNLLLLSAVFFSVKTIFAQLNYFVSPSGSDSNNGTSASTAWQTLSRASQQVFVPGDSILFERGGVYRGTFFLKGAGSAAAKIFVGAYGNGNAPVISGAEILQNPNWQNETVGGANTIKTSFNDTAYFVYTDGAFNQPARFPDDHFFFVDNALNSKES